MGKYKVTFLPDRKEIEVEEGVTLLEAAAKAGIYINSLCTYLWFILELLHNSGQYIQNLNNNKVVD